MIYRKADKTWHTPWFVLFYKKSDERKVAFVASKKVGNAVYRNRAKRLMRAHFISQINSLKSGQYIFVAKPPIIENSFQKTNKAFQDTFKKCKALLPNI